MKSSWSTSFFFLLRWDLILTRGVVIYLNLSRANFFCYNEFVEFSDDILLNWNIVWTKFLVMMILMSLDFLRWYDILMKSQFEPTFLLPQLWIQSYDIMFDWNLHTANILVISGEGYGFFLMTLSSSIEISSKLNFLLWRPWILRDDIMFHWNLSWAKLLGLVLAEEGCVSLSCWVPVNVGFSLVILSYVNISFIKIEGTLLSKKKWRNFNIK
jgi:hypothetical protein